MENELPIVEKVRQIATSYYRNIDPRMPYSDFSFLLYTYLLKEYALESIESNISYMDKLLEFDEQIQWSELSIEIDLDKQVRRILDDVNPYDLELKYMKGISGPTNAEMRNIITGDGYYWAIEEGVRRGANTLKKAEHFQPEDLTRLMLGLATLPNTAEVYNPFAGMASVGMGLKEGQTYYAQEQDARIGALATMRLSAHPHRDKVHYEQSDPVTDWNPWKKHFDLIIASPPWNTKLNDLPEGHRNPVSYFLARALEDVKENGRVVALVPSSFLFCEPDCALRKRLVDEGVLDTVIELPNGLFQSSATQPALVIIAKGRTPGSPVRMVDGTAFIKLNEQHGRNLDAPALLALVNQAIDGASLRNVGDAEVRKHDCILTPARYIRNPERTVPEGVALGTVLTSIQRSGDAAVKRIRMDDLKGSAFDPIKGTEALQQADGSGNMTSTLRSSSLLVALTGISLKPTYFEYDRVPVQLGRGISAFEVDSQIVDPGYLVTQLMSANVSEQAESLRYGTVMPSLRVEDFLSIRIPLPSLAEQADFVLREKKRLLDERARELDAFRAKLGMAQDNSVLRHNITGPLKNITYFFRKLKNGLEREKGLFNLDLLIDKDREGNDESARIVLEKLSEHISTVSDEVVRSGKTGYDVRSVALTPLNIHHFMDAFASNQGSDIHGLKYAYEFPDEESREDAWVKANDGLLRTLLDNLIENADKHAFKRHANPKDNRITLSLTLVQSPVPSVVLCVSNTGEPFPANFSKADFIKPGVRSGEFRGDGMGGWLINEIADHFGGAFELDTEPTGKMYSTVFTFHFPLIPRQ